MHIFTCLRHQAGTSYCYALFRTSSIIFTSIVCSFPQVTAATNYNKRVVECRLASVLLAKLLGVAQWESAYPLLSLVATAKLSREELLKKAEELMPADPYTFETASEALGKPVHFVSCLCLYYLGLYVTYLIFASRRPNL